MSARVFVLGSFAVDTVYRAPRIPASGETLIGSGFFLGPGGKGSNQAVAAARAGAQATFLTAIGRDHFADLARTLWRAEGINDSLVKMTEEPTGAAAILIDETTGANAIIVASGACGTLSREDVDGAERDIQKAAVFAVQLEVPMIAVLRGLQIARGAGVTTVLNPAPVPLDGLPSELLPLVDYLIPNETEAGQLTGLPVDTWDQAKRAARRLLDRGCGHVIVTLGERGSLLCGRQGEPVQIPAWNPGAVVDTTGAGDSFCGAFAVLLAEGQSAETAARFASLAAGLSVTQHGAALSMPHRRDIDRLLGGGGEPGRTTGVVNGLGS